MEKDPNDPNFNNRPVNNLFISSATKKVTNKDINFADDSSANLSNNAIRNAFVSRGEEVENTGVTFGNVTQTAPGVQDKEKQQCYNLDKKPGQAYRGLLLVLSYEKFHNSKLNRPGNAMDISKIMSTFTEQEFEVILKKNKTKENTWNIVQKASKNPEYKEYSCFIMIILSHGKVNEFYCADGQTMEYEKLFNLFQEEDCPFVAKPKLFFIQACQGGQKDHGLEEALKGDGVPDLLESDEKLRQSAEPNPHIHPKYADTLEFFCSYAGYKSYRKPLSGTWFIQTLCQMIKDYATEELNNILKRVVDSVSQYEAEDEHGLIYKQLPVIRNNTMRKLFFFSKVVK